MIYIILFLYSFYPQQPQTKTEYINRYFIYSLLCEKITGIPAEVQMAQAVIESGFGTSKIAQYSNNHFGIKYYKNTFIGGYYETPYCTKYRAYPLVFISYIDHALFMKKHYPKLKCVEACNNMSGYSERKTYWKIIYKESKTINEKYLYRH
jgi:uncharacterized FlgJ-related protein